MRARTEERVTYLLFEVGIDGVDDTTVAGGASDMAVFRFGVRM
jgi:hypothetical protein